MEALGRISDPEIPVLSILDMKIVRNLEIDGKSISVDIVPTYAACPALHMIKEQVRHTLTNMGFETVDVHTNFTEEWSTRLFDEPARSKLKAFGIAPPHATGGLDSQNIACPFCDSNETDLDSSFGSTLCKRIYYCRSCRQSFEYFKPL
jgi:ring-1,2-phenylacetyl-CoA epoxidase subunit PaaD